MKRLLWLATALIALGFTVPVYVQAATGAPSSCNLVLVTISNPSQYGITDCNNIDFNTYLYLVIDQLVPYVMLVALILIVYSGFQYMLGGAAGDVKAARSRIIGVLGGVIFFFLIRLVLNQITPCIGLNSKTGSDNNSSCGAPVNGAAATPAPATTPVPPTPKPATNTQVN